MKDDGLKADLMAKAERVIDELVGKKSSPDQITLGEIERLVIEMGARNLRGRAASVSRSE
ncbi:MAG: hypothetical protein ABI947_29120 [Chloroflexota bacterium]